jgi:hypothetical protein
MAITLCGTIGRGPHGQTVYCTRPAGHAPDEHIAAIGPAEPGTPVIARWPVVADPRAPQAKDRV